MPEVTLQLTMMVARTTAKCATCNQKKKTLFGRTQFGNICEMCVTDFHQMMTSGVTFAEVEEDAPLPEGPSEVK